VDCILDFDEPPFLESQEALEANKDIEIRGELNKESMKIIYKGILKSSDYSARITLGIHDSLNKIGITGLTKP
jgi:hypothetical protein